MIFELKKTIFSDLEEFHSVPALDFDVEKKIFTIWIVMLIVAFSRYNGQHKENYKSCQLSVN
jgi:hypothetical protein